MCPDGFNETKSNKALRGARWSSAPHFYVFEHERQIASRLRQLEAAEAHGLADDAVRDGIARQTA